MFCQNCGRQQQGDERFCAECGTPYTIVYNTPQQSIVPPPISSKVASLAETPIPSSPIGVYSASHSSEEKRCPNCGANYTNTKNCEYCGSLLVRFVEHHIEIDQTMYGDAAEKLTGLEQALKVNLQEQEDAEGTYHITTSINAPILPVAIEVCSPIAIKDKVSYTINDYPYTSLPNKAVESDSISLLVCFRFFEFDSHLTLFDGSLRNFNNNNKIQLDRFKQMKVFPLFTYMEESVYSIGGAKCGKLHSYYIDFGKDYKGAAAIITQYMRKVHNIIAIKNVDFEYNMTSISDADYKEELESVKNSMSCLKMVVIIFIGICCVIAIWFFCSAMSDIAEGAGGYWKLVSSVLCFAGCAYMFFLLKR